MPLATSAQPVQTHPGATAAATHHNRKRQREQQVGRHDRGDQRERAECQRQALQPVRGGRQRDPQPPTWDGGPGRQAAATTTSRLLRQRGPAGTEARRPHRTSTPPPALRGRRSQSRPRVFTSHRGEKRRARRAVRTANGGRGDPPVRLTCRGTHLAVMASWGVSSGEPAPDALCRSLPSAGMAKSLLDACRKPPDCGQGPGWNPGGNGRDTPSGATWAHGRHADGRVIGGRGHGAGWGPGRARGGPRGRATQGAAVGKAEPAPRACCAEIDRHVIPSLFAYVTQAGVEVGRLVRASRRRSFAAVEEALVDSAEVIAGKRPGDRCRSAMTGPAVRRVRSCTGVIATSRRTRDPREVRLAAPGDAAQAQLDRDAARAALPDAAQRAALLVSRRDLAARCLHVTSRE